MEEEQWGIEAEPESSEQLEMEFDECAGGSPHAPSESYVHDMNMRDDEESSTEASDDDEALDMAKSLLDGDADKAGFGISGSPPKLINTPPSTLEQRVRSPRSLKARRHSSMAALRISDTQIRRCSSVGGTLIGGVATTEGLEDGRHNGGTTVPKGKLFRQIHDDPEAQQRKPMLARSRSLPDFMEVEVVGELQKKSQKSSGNSSPRSGMRDWDEDSPNGIALMLPSPRDELRHYLHAHQAADEGKALGAAGGRPAMMMPQMDALGQVTIHGSAPQQIRRIERDRKRPSTDPGSRRADAAAREQRECDAANDKAACEISRAFKDWAPQLRF